MKRYKLKMSVYDDLAFAIFLKINTVATKRIWTLSGTFPKPKFTPKYE